MFPIRLHLGSRCGVSMLGTQHKNVTSLLFTHLIRTEDHLFVSPSITPLLHLKLANSTNGSRHRLLFPGTIILLCLGFCAKFTWKTRLVSCSPGTKNGIFRPVRQPACCLCLVKHSLILVLH